MRHAPRRSLRAHPSACGLLLVLLLVSCGGPEAASLEPADPVEIVSFGASSVNDEAPREVAFAWKMSHPTDGDPTCRIDANGDGVHEREASCTSGAYAHTYEEAGTYRAELRATAAGRSARATTTVTVGEKASADPSGDAPEGDAMAPFGEPQALGTFRPALPYRYDRIVMDDTHALVGVPADPTNDAYAGGVIVYGRGDDGTWTRTSTIEPPGDAIDALGEHLALDGTTLAVTANRRNPATDAQEAVVYLYELATDGAWLPTRALLEGEGISPSSLTLALRDGLLAVGHRPSFSAADAEGGGFPVGVAVRLFERDAGGADAWGEVAPLPAPERDDGREGFFGADIDIAPGGTLLAVADTAQESDSGFGTYVFLFERSAPGDPWTLTRTFVNEELPSPYSAMLELDDDTLVVTPMAARETTRADLAVFERDAGGADAWERAATVTVEVSTPPDEFLPRHVLLATGLANDTLVVGIGPSGCIDLRADPGPGPAPCAGGRVYVLEASDDSEGWDTRRVIDDPTGAERSSYGEYVAISPSGDTIIAGGVVLPADGAAYTHAELYEREPVSEMTESARR